MTTPRQPTTPSPDPLAEHGLDFVEDAVADLRKEPPTKRESQRAVVLLAMGIELLLKSRLLAEHWSLVFDNVDKASLKALHDGSLKSVGPEQCVERLANVCNVAMNVRLRGALRGLWEYRNKIVHFAAAPLGLEALRIRAFEVLSELFDFVRRHGQLAESNEARIGGIQRSLHSVGEFITKRNMAIENSLPGLPDGGYWCPSCHQRAIDVAGGLCECLFCEDAAYPGDVIEAHLTRELGYDDVVRPDDKNLALCRACSTEEASVRYVILSRRDGEAMRCLYCGVASRQSELRRCSSCHHWVTPSLEGGDFRCPNCPACSVFAT